MSIVTRAFPRFAVYSALTHGSQHILQDVLQSGLVLVESSHATCGW